MSVLSAPPVSPFRGLSAFADSELDALFFFGREREREVLVANLLASRLTVLYGESGVGKSSLLAAAVVRDLREAAPDAAVVMHGSWSGRIDLLHELDGVDEGYLILDQFEEYFLYHADESGPGALLHDLPELLYESRVNVLIALREDALARLDAFKARIPSIFANQIRLDHLDRREATRAIVGPLARWTELTGEVVGAEPSLVEAVLDETRTPDGNRIEPPYLQLVLERLWEAEREAGATTLRRETLRRLGGASAIVRDHLHVALEALQPEEQDVAASMFEHLVTPSGTKIAHRAPDLAEYAHVPEPTLRRVLSRLSGDRIVHSVEGSDRYEIFHDVLAEPISAWRLHRRLDQERAAAQRRQRRLLVVAVVSLVALGVVAGLAVWAISERGTARSQARHARARELEALALQQLTVDPNRSLGFGLAAARLEHDRTVEDVLRQALVADRLRAVFHTHGPVSAVAVEAGGPLVAGAAAHDIVVADAARGRVIRTLKSRRSYTALAFEGTTRLAAATANGAVRVWSLTSGRELQTLVPMLGASAGPQRIVLVPERGALRRAADHIAFVRAAPDGSAIAAGVYESDSRVHAVLFRRDGTRLHELPGIGVDSLAFSPDSRVLAVGDARSLTTLWSVRTGKRVAVLDDDGARAITSIAYSPDGSSLATGSEDGDVRVWDVARRQRLLLFVGHANAITSVEWSPDGRVLASASHDRTIRLWAVRHVGAPGSAIATLAGDRDSVGALAFTPDGTRLVSGSGDATMRIWDVRPDQTLQVVGSFRTPVLGAQVSDKAVVAVASDGTADVFDARARRVLRTFSALPRAVGFAVGGPVIAVAGANGEVGTWDSTTGRRLTRTGGTAPVTAVAVAPSGRFAASADKSGVHVWSVPAGRGFDADQPGVTALAFAPTGAAIAAADGHGVVVRSLAGPVLRRLAVPGGVVRVAYAPTGAVIAAGDRDGTVWIFSTSSGRLLHVLRGHALSETALDFSADGSLLATSSLDGDGRVWDVATGRTIHILRAHGGPLADVAFSPDARWLVTAGPVTAGLWPEGSGRLLFYLRGHTDLLTSVAFARSGWTVVTAGRDRTVRTYACGVCVGLDGLVRLAEQRLALTR